MWWLLLDGTLHSPQFMSIPCFPLLDLDALIGLVVKEDWTWVQSSGLQASEWFFYTCLLANEFLNLSGEWYSLTLKLCEKVCQLLWHAYRLSSVNNLKVYSKRRISYNFISLYIVSILWFSAIIMWFAMMKCGVINYSLTHNVSSTSLASIIFISSTWLRIWVVNIHVRKYYIIYI